MPLSPYFHAAQWAYLRAAGTAAAQAVAQFDCRAVTAETFE